jgi:hypothetical protein
VSIVPPLGDVDLVPSRRCTRLLRFDESGKEQLCDVPAIVHVDWGDACGFVCDEHAHEAIALKWQGRASHELGSYCGMPGASWFDCEDGTSFCAYEGDEIQTAEPVRAVAEPSAPISRKAK